MSAITTQYDAFSGPGFLTLLNGGPMIGPAPVEYQDANGDWNWLYDENRLVMVGPMAETIEVNVVGDWRVASSYSIKDDPSVIAFSFYNAELVGQPDHGPFTTAGNPWRPRPLGPKGLTTYYHTFSGSGVMVLSGPGSILSRPIVEVSDGTNWKPYLNEEGVQFGFDMGGEAVEFKSTDDFRIVYQIADAIGVDDTTWAFTAYDYVNGYVPPPVTLIPGDNAAWENEVGVTTDVGTILADSGGWAASGTFGSIPANTDGEIFFTAGQINATGHIGLNTDPGASPDQFNIDYGIGLSSDASATANLNGGFQVFIVNPYTIATVFSVARVGTDIQYKVDGVVEHTIAAGSTEELFFDTSFFHAGCLIENISMVVA